MVHQLHRLQSYNIETIYITISTFTSVCPYGVRRRRRRHVTSHFRFLSCSGFQKPSQTASERSEAELRILDFKTTWSEFQMPSQTAPAEVRILDFKTTWSEFHHLPRVSPKQLCALAHLGCTRAAGTS